MEQIWDFLKISSSTFCLGEPKCTETDLKKFQSPIWVQSDPNWGKPWKLKTLEVTRIGDKLARFEPVVEKTFPILFELQSVISVIKVLPILKENIPLFKQRKKRLQVKITETMILLFVSLQKILIWREILDLIISFRPRLIVLSKSGAVLNYQY